MNKILSFIVCLITVNLVNSLQYHVQLDMGPEEFPRVPGSLFLHSSSKLDDSIRENLLKKTTISSGKTYVIGTNIDLEVGQLNKISFSWKSEEQNVETPIYLNRLNLIPSYIKDNVQRTRSKLKLCPSEHEIYSNRPVLLQKCQFL